MKIYFLVLFILIFFNGFAQPAIPPENGGTNVNVGLVSPSMSALNVYKDISVSHFTGRLGLSYDLGAAITKGLKVPIYISYDGSGNKVDQYPGIVGLGWNMQAGGSIKRLYKSLTSEEVGNGVPSELGVVPTAKPNWSDPTILQQDLASNNFYAIDSAKYDVFEYSFLGFSGLIAFDHTNTARIISKGDNFTVKFEILNTKTINFPMKGINLYKQFPGFDTWIMPEGFLDMLSPKPIFFRNLLYKVTLTDNEGTSYIFGGTDSSIEFRRAGSAKIGDFSQSHEVHAVNWYLTKIENNRGEIIELNYERDIYQLHKSRVVSSDVTIVPAINHSRSEEPVLHNHFSATLINPCYLVSINTPVSRVIFHNSRAEKQLQVESYHELIYPGVPIENYSDHTTIDHRIHFEGYMDFRNVLQTANRLIYDSNFPLKLDSISFYDLKNEVIDRIAFKYTQDTSERIKLLSFYKKSGLKKNMTYSFIYNSLKLPKYLSPSQDHYGYYNGNQFQIDELFSNDPMKSKETSFVNDYYIGREPNNIYAQAEMLDTIVLPTGERQVIEYELHTYSKYVTRDPHGIGNVSLSLYAPGLRVKKIKQFEAGRLSDQTEYDYNTGSLSNGIRSHTPFYSIYLEGNYIKPAMLPSSARYFGLFKRAVFNNHSLNPRDATDGPVVTYTTVKEIKLDGSAMEFTYKNYDNGYNDLPYISKASDHPHLYNEWHNENGSSMELERGQILRRNFFKSDNTLLRSESFFYRDDLERLEEYIRFYKKKRNLAYAFNAFHQSFRVAAGKRFYYYPSIKQKEVKEYFYKPDNSRDSLVFQESFLYDENRELKLHTIKNSKNEEVYTLSLHSEDYNVNTGFVALLRAYKDKRSIIEKIVIKHSAGSNFVVAGELNVYSPEIPGLLLGKYTLNTNRLPKDSLFMYSNNSSGMLAKYKSLKVVEYLYLLTAPGFSKNVDYRKQSEILQFDEYNNPLEIVYLNNQYQSYLWGYKGQYAVGKFNGLKQSDIALVLNSADLNSLNDPNVSEFTIHDKINSLRYHPATKHGLVESYSYKPLVGIHSKTDPLGNIEYYDYDVFGRLVAIRNKRNEIVKTFCYNIIGEIIDCQVSLRSVLDKVDGIRSSFIAGYMRTKTEACSYSVSLSLKGFREPTPIEPSEPMEAIETLHVYSEADQFFLPLELSDMKFYAGLYSNSFIDNGYYMTWEVSNGKYVWHCVYAGKVVWSGTCDDPSMPDLTQGPPAVPTVGPNILVNNSVHEMVRFDDYLSVCPYRAGDHQNIQLLYYSNNPLSVIHCFVSPSSSITVPNGYYTHYKTIDSGPNYWYYIQDGVILNYGRCSF